MPYKAYFLSDISYSYDKWRYGSFRHYIPNHCALGYMKLSVARYYSVIKPFSCFSDITKYPYWPFIYEKRTVKILATELLIYGNRPLPGIQTSGKHKMLLKSRLTRRLINRP